MPDVSYHLQKAKLAWMSNHGSKEAKQTCIRDIFGDGKDGEGCFWVNIDGAGGGGDIFLHLWLLLICVVFFFFKL